MYVCTYVCIQTQVIQTPNKISPDYFLIVLRRGLSLPLSLGFTQNTSMGLQLHFLDYRSEAATELSSVAIITIPSSGTSQDSDKHYI